MYLYNINGDSNKGFGVVSPIITATEIMLKSTIILMA